MDKNIFLENFYIRYQFNIKWITNLGTNLCSKLKCQSQTTSPVIFKRRAFYKTTRKIGPCFKTVSNLCSRQKS